jgi:hypothetical protein
MGNSHKATGMRPIIPQHHFASSLRIGVQLPCGKSRHGGIPLSGRKLRAASLTLPRVKTEDGQNPLLQKSLSIDPLWIAIAAVWTLNQVPEQSPGASMHASILM